jgi:adenosylcobinamide-phosphate synthase
MILDHNWYIIVLVALMVDLTVGEFPGKHPVEFMGDFIKFYEKQFYKNTVFRGCFLTLLLLIVVLIIATSLQFMLNYLSAKYFNTAVYSAIIIGIFASTGLASKTLKQYVQKVINTDGEQQKKNLSILVTRNTATMNENKIYGSLIESHAENLSDGYIGPLLFLVFFGLPGIMVYKAVSTLDSMIGYKNEKYINYGKMPAMLDDVLNYIPARLTALLIWLISSKKVSWKILSIDAGSYSSSPNAGYPISAAAYELGIPLGGPVYYGDHLVDKAVVGEERTQNYKEAALLFIKMHIQLDFIITGFFLLIFLFNISAKWFNIYS